MLFNSPVPWLYRKLRGGRYGNDDSLQSGNNVAAWGRNMIFYIDVTKAGGVLAATPWINAARSRLKGVRDRITHWQEVSQHEYFLD